MKGLVDVQKALKRNGLVWLAYSRKSDRVIAVNNIAEIMYGNRQDFRCIGMADSLCGIPSRKQIEAVVEERLFELDQSDGE